MYYASDDWLYEKAYEREENEKSSLVEHYGTRTHDKMSTSLEAVIEELYDETGMIDPKRIYDNLTVLADLMGLDIVFRENEFAAVSLYDYKRDVVRKDQDLKEMQHGIRRHLNSIEEELYGTEPLNPFRVSLSLGNISWFLKDGIHKHIPSQLMNIKRK